MARATMLNPQVVLLDEPSMGLARILVEEVFRSISRLESEGVTLLLVEQFAADLTATVNATGERGLLDMALDPGFASNGRFCVNCIDSTTLNTVVTRYQMTTLGAEVAVADAGSAQTVLGIAQPNFSKHKAGWLGFRPGSTLLLLAGLAVLGLWARRLR